MPDLPQPPMPQLPAPFRDEKNSETKKKKAKKKKSGGSSFSALFGAKDTASRIAETIEKQAASQKRQAVAKASLMPTDPYQALQDQLFGAINNIEIAPTPLDELRRMATTQVSSQYDPMIQALVSQMDAKKGRGKRSQGQAREMYGALQKDFISQLPALTEQFAAEDQATNARYDEAQKMLESEYGKQSAEQDAVLRRLGVQAAAPEASQQARDDQAYFQNQIELDQNQALNALNQEQLATQTYQRDLGNNAKMAGENTAQEIGQMLEDYLTEAEGQLGGLRAQKSSGIEALLSQMQQQDAQRIESQRQQEIDNMMKMFNFQLDATKAGQSAGGSSANSLFKGNKGLEGATNYLAQQYPDQPILARNLMEQLNDVLKHKEIVDGKFILDPGNESLGKGPTYSDVGQERMMKLLRDEFKQEGNRYSAQDINATMNALLAYLGKL